MKLPSRAKQAEEKGSEVFYPPLSPEAGYFIDYMLSLDFIEPGMAGPVRLSFTEIYSWSKLHGVQLKPWEVTLIRKMSTEFASEVSAAESPQRPAPWTPEVVAVDQTKLASHIKDVLRGR
ncbi:hypothetical protein HNP33_002078 [Comamonas odontotermitis]|uniref:Uncharacterized protein n=1 Tax=Comamonas odontotermitis TaxID=379895 RepID=A0ABR6RFS5_9BURK|nr:hypothetical protein [Comamonas odontotermitis]MBB6578010.1 hypothetical protein [Comamonas odontotermitis]